MELSKPNHLISLASSAVLISIDINVWSATKQDREVSDEITASKNADKSAGRYVKQLLADNSKHKAIVNYRQTIYNWLQTRTYGWNKSQQLLPVVDLPKFKAEYNAHELAFYHLIDDFIVNYDSIVSDMAFKQGTMFNRNDYPTASQVRDKFAVQLYVSEVPMNDFRCNIAQDIADDLFNTYTKQAENIINNIQSEQADRFIDVMESISHCCGIDDLGNDKTKKRKIYESTIQKAKEYCETFKGFNLSNSSELEEARASLERALHGVSAEDIRESDAVRNKVKENVDDILSKFSSFKCL
jgi:hypothetical protein